MSFSSLNTLVGFIYLQKKTMKNKFLVIALYLVGVSANAQFTFLDIVMALQLKVELQLVMVKDKLVIQLAITSILFLMIPLRLFL